MHRFVVRAKDSTEDLGAYPTLEEARLWAKRLAFANTVDVEIHDVVESRMIEERRNETEIILDDAQTNEWRANDAALRDKLQAQATRFECAIIVMSRDGERLARLEPS
jgi:hypothetical protein